MDEITTNHLFDISGKVDNSLDLRNTKGIGKVIIPVLGGTFEGSRLRGTVLPVGADWLSAEDGYGKVDVRLVLQTDDNALIYMIYRGIHTINESVRARIVKGEEVDASEYYFRTAPLFETASTRYNWLNKIVSIGTGTRRQNSVDYRVFEVL